ncbi:conserved hypothetical protein [Neospora caninum Liverpool]|uniref:Trimethylguanosine synthase n=1 Tax=Neospora caninum (strain Liverpool) TaxID=572307 RepID=F0V9M7_NEOCL|nr:conserved hypothetical protein [Neospora caninum Liverpool]CBZ50453.1 conserved hypothetical protein [Neospora caninum Liverpool]CEL65062.1 TPA: RNA cap guanine-N2 methyltransferase [Neospora caninum Liverpool]|eukprot:XP_003880486.1 conserved hypothetical protein [Neospora caninum Liverpool]
MPLPAPAPPGRTGRAGPPPLSPPSLAASSVPTPVSVSGSSLSPESSSSVYSLHASSPSSVPSEPSALALPSSYRCIATRSAPVQLPDSAPFASPVSLCRSFSSSTSSPPSPRPARSPPNTPSHSLGRALGSQAPLGSCTPRSAKRTCLDGLSTHSDSTPAPNPVPPLASGCSAGVPGLPPASLFLCYTLPEELDLLLLDPTAVAAEKTSQKPPPRRPRGGPEPGETAECAACAGAGTGEDRQPRADGLRTETEQVNGSGPLNKSQRLAQSEGIRDAERNPEADAPLRAQSPSCVDPVARADSSGAKRPGPVCADGPAPASTSPESSDGPRQSEAPDGSPAARTRLDALPAPGAGDRGDSSSGGSGGELDASGSSDREKLQCSCIILLTRWTRYGEVVSGFAPAQGSASRGVSSRAAPVLQDSLCASACSPTRGNSGGKRRAKDATECSPIFPGPPPCRAEDERFTHDLAVEAFPPHAPAPTSAAVSQPLGIFMKHLDQLCPAEFLLLARCVKDRLPYAIRAILDEAGDGGNPPCGNWKESEFSFEISDKIAAAEEPIRLGLSTHRRDTRDQELSPSIATREPEEKHRMSPCNEAEQADSLSSGAFPRVRAPSELKKVELSGAPQLDRGGAHAEHTRVATSISQVSEDREETQGEAGEGLEEARGCRGPQSRFVFSSKEVHGSPSPAFPEGADEALSGVMEELEQQLCDLQLRTGMAPSCTPVPASTAQPKRSKGLNPNAPPFRSLKTPHPSIGISPGFVPLPLTGSSLLGSVAPRGSAVPVLPPCPAPRCPRARETRPLADAAPAEGGMAEAAVCLPCFSGGAPGGSGFGDGLLSGWGAGLVDQATGVPVLGDAQTQPGVFPGPPDCMQAWTRTEGPGGRPLEGWGGVAEQRDSEFETDELELMRALGLPTQFASSRHTARHRKTHREEKSYDFSPPAVKTSPPHGYPASGFWPGVPGAPETHAAINGVTPDFGSWNAAALAPVQPCAGAVGGEEEPTGRRKCACGTLADACKQYKQDPGGQGKPAPKWFEGSKDKTPQNDSPVASSDASLLPAYDRVGNSTDSSYYRLRYTLFHKYDEGMLLDENAWFETTAECIAAYLASVLHQVSVHARTQSLPVSGSLCVARNASPKSSIPCVPSAREALDARETLPEGSSSPGVRAEKASGTETCVREVVTGFKNDAPVSASDQRSSACTLGSLPTARKGDAQRTAQGEIPRGAGGRNGCQRRNVPREEAAGDSGVPTASRPLVAMDGCCGAGGNVIQFARFFDACVGVDCDLVKVAICKHNASLYGVRDQVYVHHNTLAGWLQERQAARRQLRRARKEAASHKCAGREERETDSQTFDETDRESLRCFCCKEFSRVKCRFCVHEGHSPGSSFARFFTEECRNDRLSEEDLAALHASLFSESPSRPLTHQRSLVTDIAWCFMSPPWSGPSYSGRRSFRSQLFSVAGGQDGGGGVGSAHIPSLVKAAARIAPNVCLFLPRSTNVHELAALAVALRFPLLEIEVLYSHFIDRTAGDQSPSLFPKAVIAYLVRDVASWVAIRGLPAESPVPGRSSSSGPGCPTQRPAGADQSPCRTWAVPRGSRSPGGAAREACEAREAREGLPAARCLQFRSPAGCEKLPAYAWLSLTPYLRVREKTGDSPCHSAGSRDGEAHGKKRKGCKKSRVSATPKQAETRPEELTLPCRKEGKRDRSAGADRVSEFWTAALKAIGALLEREDAEAPREWQLGKRGTATERSECGGRVGKTESRGKAEEARQNSPATAEVRGKKSRAHERETTDTDSVPAGREKGVVSTGKESLFVEEGEKDERERDASDRPTKHPDKKRARALGDILASLQDETMLLEEILTAAATAEEGHWRGKGTNTKWDTFLDVLGARS